MMSFSRYTQALTSVPANARKVYEVIPIAECWTYSKIHQEMRRQGHNMRTEVIMGCVVALKDAGLVREPSQSQFQRAPHKPKPELPALTLTTTEPAEVSQTIVPIQTKPAAAPPDRMDKLAALSGRVRALADMNKRMQEEAASIADDLDDIAVVIEEQLGAESTELQKLRNFHRAFKELG